MKLFLLIAITILAIGSFIAFNDGKELSAIYFMTMAVFLKTELDKEA